MIHFTLSVTPGTKLTFSSLLFLNHPLPQHSNVLLLCNYGLFCMKDVTTHKSGLSMPTRECIAWTLSRDVSNDQPTGYGRCSTLNTIPTWNHTQWLWKLNTLLLYMQTARGGGDGWRAQDGARFYFTPLLTEEWRQSIPCSVWLQ